MQCKELLFKQDAQLKIKTGIDIVANAVVETLGPKGRNVMIEKSYGNPIITKDGVTVAKNIKLKDKFEDLGAALIREVAEKTNDDCGDGPQPLYSKILSPTGWVKMGDIKEGMTICGTNGTSQRVIGVFPKGKKEIYKVILKDGRIIECCVDHLWKIITAKGKEKIMTVKELINSGKITKTDKNGYIERGFYLPHNVVEFEENEKSLTLDPYFLGTLIGDGSLSGSGEVELSLGPQKEHILKKLKLPKGVIYRSTFIEKKNYFRIKFSKNSILKKALKELGLHGTKSNTKFIPKCYLFSNLKTRKALLQGLIDTDGYKNNRGLFEFSTVGTQLAFDFQELCRGLGIPIYIHLYARDMKDGAYSNTPIYRICQLEGYKYGYSIDSIEKTGQFTEMQCIKVSNPDNLYITNDYVVTHNTTSATLLAQAIIKEGMLAMSAGANPIKIKNGIEQATEDVVKYLKEMSVKLGDNPEKIEQVASISANDEKIGKIVAQSIQMVGNKSPITVEESQGSETTLNVVHGAQLDRGFISPYFVNNPERMESVLEGAKILITDYKITTTRDIVPVLENAIQNGCRTLFILAEDVTGEALSVLLVNKIKGGLNVCAVKLPNFGSWKKEMMEDIAILTGATIISEDHGNTFDKFEFSMLGQADKIVVDKDKTIIMDARGDKKLIDERIKQLESETDRVKSDLDKTKLKERQGKLSGGVAILKVGGSTEMEIKEKKDRIEDSLSATKAAIEEGILPGGGLALFRASESQWINKCADYEEGIGYNLLIKAIQYPMKKIAENAGVSGDVVADRLSEKEGSDNDKYATGFNAKTLAYEKLMENGIIDPTKVVINSLQNAVSVATLFLTTNVAIAVHHEEKQEPNY
jgi:chaperonin GroEL